MEDTVSMVAVVGTDGRVIRVEEVKAASPQTAKIASEHVRAWVFGPAASRGAPVSYRLAVNVAIRPGQDDDSSADHGAAIGRGVELQTAEPIYETIPEYPAGLKAAPVQGFAKVNLLVGAEGRPEDPVVEYASRPEFSAPAAAAVLDWKFQPTRRGGAAVATRTTVSVVFPQESAAWDASERTHQAQLAYARSYDTAPQNKTSSIVVYPFDALMEGRQLVVTLAVLVSTEGHVVQVSPGPGSDTAFVGAARASLATWTFFPAEKAGLPVYGLVAMQFSFDPHRENFEFDETSHALIQALRENTAAILSLRAVDQMPKPRKQVAPKLPADHAGAMEGEVLIEFIVDANGRPQLPRVVRATDPDLGWTAATAVAQWRFEPAVKDGKPVACRVRVPVKFTPPDPAG